MRSAIREVGLCTLVLFASAQGLIGCSAPRAGQQVNHPAPVHVKAPELSEAAFAPAVVALLAKSEPDKTRSTQIASTIRHLLARARGYFERHQPQLGLNAAIGALLLARTGELHPKSLTGYSGVLVNAADEAARRGDEGQSRAFYELAKLADDGDPTVSSRAAEHLAALRNWEGATQSDGTMQAAASNSLTAAKRALVRREAAIVGDAEKQIVRWVERAIEISRMDTPIQSMFDHDERIAARLAFLTGAQTMIALHLRDGDAAGALGALDNDVMTAIREPRWVSGLIAASEGDSNAWLDWYQLFHSVLEQPEFFDTDLARAAQWGIAVELFRSDQESIASALPLLSLLNYYGMPDVAPAVLARRGNAAADGEGAAATEQQARTAAVGLVFQSLGVLEQRNDIGLARLVFTHAQPLLARSGDDGDVSSKQPKAVDFYEMMGALEVSNGYLDRAWPLLQQAMRTRPSVDTLRMLASIERQRTHLEESLGLTRQLQALSSEQNLPIAESQSWLMMYDLLLDLGRTEEADATLGKALEQLLLWRQKPATPRFAAAVERNLAQVLERYGQLDGARRANERARTASVADVTELSDVLLDEVRRALTFGELSHGRLALRHALDSGIENSALTYAALWQHLLELRLHAASDGTVEEAFSRVQGQPGWGGALSQWAAGKLSDQELLAQAGSNGETVEAHFYAAIRQFFQTPSDPNRVQLQTVAQSSAINLIEVRIARDLLATAARRSPPQVPSGLVLP